MNEVDERPHVGTDMERAVAALGAAGYQAYSNCLVGHAAPMVTRYFNRVKNPEPGDLVLETSTFYARDLRGYGHVAVGTLVERKVESLVYEEDGLESQPYQEEAWYVTPLTGGETIRWTNADFIAIPASRQQGIDWTRDASE